MHGTGGVEEAGARLWCVGSDGVIRAAAASLEHMATAAVLSRPSRRSMLGEAGGDVDVGRGRQGTTPYSQRAPHEFDSYHTTIAAAVTEIPKFKVHLMNLTHTKTVMSCTNI